MKKLNRAGVIVLWVVAIVIALQIIIPLLSSHLVGTDDQAVELIQLIAPNYKPWFEQVELFDSENSENILFTIQCVLGLLVIAYYSITKGRRRVKN